MRAILAGKIVSAWGIPDPCSPWNKVFLLVPWNRSFGNPGCSGSETLCGDGILSEERRNRGNTILLSATVSPDTNKHLHLGDPA